MENKDDKSQSLHLNRHKGAFKKGCCYISPPLSLEMGCQSLAGGIPLLCGTGSIVEVSGDGIKNVTVSNGVVI